MTFFEKELRKIAESCEYIQDPKFIGRSCVFRLTDSITAKMKFESTVMADNYNALKIELINRNEGNIDTQRINFKDIWGTINTGSDVISPHAWTFGYGTEWYRFMPDREQYNALSEKIDEYLECFADISENITETEWMTM